MKLTEQHISEESLLALILTVETLLKKSDTEWYRSILSTAMELKQRRAEDRQLEHDNAKTDA